MIKSFGLRIGDNFPIIKRDTNIFKDFGCEIGDRLYVAIVEKNKVCEFLVDCLKVFENDFTAHGYIYNLNGNWGTPTEFSLKKLNKRVIFTEKENAELWLEVKRYEKERKIKDKELVDDIVNSYIKKIPQL